MAKNQVRNGTRVLWKRVPAVGRGLIATGPALLEPSRAQSLAAPLRAARADESLGPADLAQGHPEGQGFRLRPFVLDPAPDQQDYQAVVAYQGAMAFVYLADRSTCPAKGSRCDWSRPPRLREDVMPVVRAFYEVNQTGEPIRQLRGTIDLIFSRSPTTRGRVAPPFKVFDGKKLVSIPLYLATHPRPDLIDLDRRMRWLAAGPYGDRAGDILLLARSGLSRPIGDRYYFSGPYHSWHGSPSEQDSHVPLMVASKEESGKELRALVTKVVGGSPSQLEVVPLVRKLLER